MVLVNAQYKFQPIASTRVGRIVSFTIQHKPGWASFDSATGTLSGTPTAADVGTYLSIVISASNGTSSADLPEFAIAVTQAGNAAVTVSWTPPTSNSDGTEITNLAGYQIEYGSSPAALLQTINVNSVGLTSYVIENLTPGTWYFAIKAINGSGVSSNQSGVVQFTVTGS